MTAAARGTAVDTVVFDFGGVLFRWEPHDLLARLLPEHAPALEAAMALRQHFFQGYDGDWAEFDRGTVEAGDLARRIATRTGLSLAEVRSVIDAVPDALEPMPETVALLERLHQRGHALYFLSNMPAPYATHLEETHGFLKRFRTGVFSAREQLIKPEPAIYALAAERFGIEPARMLFIDDLPANVEAARAAGWQALHFEGAPGCAAALERLGLL